MWHMVELIAQSHQWTGVELLVIALFVLCMSVLLVDLVGAGFSAARQAWRRRGIRRLQQVGGADGYVDQGRVHREAMSMVDRVASAAALPSESAALATGRTTQSFAGGRQPGAARTADARGLGPAGGVRLDAEGRSRAGAADASARQPLVSRLSPGAARGRALDSDTGDAQSTTLVYFPDASKRVNGNGHHA
jgi:hypothetical protein